MGKRFEVMVQGLGIDAYYWIRDNEASKWAMPERAVTINFGKSANVDLVADCLNREWANFNRNPT